MAKLDPRNSWVFYPQECASDVFPGNWVVGRMEQTSWREEFGKVDKFHPSGILHLLDFTEVGPLK